jgi:hypothetical protein
VPNIDRDTPNIQGLRTEIRVVPIIDAGEQEIAQEEDPFIRKERWENE